VRRERQAGHAGEPEQAAAAEDSGLSVGTDRNKARKFKLGNTNLHPLSIGNTNYNLHFVFGQCPADIGPETRSDGSGSKNGCRTHPQLSPQTNSKAVS
jgi:hypothetical protein